jgi:CheY-like chemotaxis protein
LLPRAPDEEPSVSLQPPVSAPILSGRILVVEDETMVRKTIQRSLAAFHQLTLADSAPEALALLESGQRFDAILCDLMMPRVTGMELHQLLLERFPDQARRMLFVSGGAFVPEAVDFLRSMESRHLEKPFSPLVLRGMVQELIGRLGPPVA